MKRVIVFLALFLIYVNGATIWLQQDPIYTNGIFSGNYNENKNLTVDDPTNYNVVAADDFIIPNGLTVSINAAWFWGFFTNASSASNIKNWTVTVWGNTLSPRFSTKNIPDAANVLYNQTVSVTGTQPSSYNMTFTTTLNLGAGKYWIGMYPTFKGATMDYKWLNYRLNASVAGTDKFTWYESAGYFFVASDAGQWVPFDNNPYLGYTPYQFGSGGWDLGFGLYGGIYDIQPPVLNKGSLSATNVAYPNPISFTLNVTDNWSGTASVILRLTSPAIVSHDISLDIISGDGENGIWSGSYIFNMTEPSGTWTVTGITVLDYSSNSKYYAGANLTSALSPRVFTLTGTTTTGSATTSSSTSAAAATTSSTSGATSAAATSASSTGTSAATSSTTGLVSTATSSSASTTDASTSATASTTTSAATSAASTGTSAATSAASTGTSAATSTSTTGSSVVYTATFQFTTVNTTTLDQFLAILASVLSIETSRFQVSYFNLLPNRDMTYKSQFYIVDDADGLLAYQTKNLADSGAFAAYGWTAVSVSVSTQAVSSSTTGANQILDRSSPKSSSNTGAIVGGVIGGIAAIAIIAVVAFFLLKKNKAKNSARKSEASENPTELQKVESQQPTQTSNNSSNNTAPNLTINYGTLPSQPTSPATSKSPLPTASSSNSPLPPAQTNYNAIPIAPPARSFIDNIRIDYNELEIEKEIGKGAFGVVYRGRWRGGVVAIKQIQGQMTKKELEDFQMEAQTMKNLRPHVNVVQFLGVTLDPHPLCLVTEFLDQGSLYDYLQSESKVDTNVIMNVVKGIAAGMLHLHREGIIHRDLAARNILLGSGFQVKISDFGLSRQNGNAQSNQTKSDTGPLKWMAPESIKNREYSTATDVWAFGVTVWEIITRKEPYPDLDSVQTALAVVHNNLRLEIPSYCPIILARVMTACFQTDPSQRPDFDTIFKHLQNARLDEWTGMSNSSSTATVTTSPNSGHNARPTSNTYDSMAAVQVNMNAPSPVANTNKHYSQFQ